MRAIVITSFGGPEALQLREVPDPEPSRDEILVRVRATALNRADLSERRGRYPPPPATRARLPAHIPGLEYAGEVDSVGADVQEWSPGDRVMGLVAGGAYAERVVAHAREALPIPGVLGFEEAAAVPEVFTTAHDALFTRLALGPGERLLIHAVGSGVGTAALQLARAAGATVYGTSRSAWKLERAAKLGLEAGIDASAEDFADVIAERTGGEGVHAIMDLVGGAYLAGNLRSLAPLGRQVVVGIVSGGRAEIDLAILMRGRATLVGTVLRARPLEEKIAAARGLARHVLPLLADGRVRPIVDRVLPASEAADAHRVMEEDRNFGKIVLRW